MLSTTQIAADLAVTPATIRKWHRNGLITGRRIDGRREHLYHPGQHRPDLPRLAAGRPAGTAHLLTSSQLAAKLAVTACTVTRWHDLGLIDSPARDQRDFRLYHPDQRAVDPFMSTYVIGVTGRTGRCPTIAWRGGIGPGCDYHAEAVPH